MGQPIDRFPRPPYDPEIEPVVRAAAEAAAADNSDSSFLESLDIAKLRKEALERERPRTEALLRDERVTCRDLTIPGVRDGVMVQLEQADDVGVRRIAALVVAPEQDEAAILAALRQGVDPVFLPRRIRFLGALPRAETGKLPRADVLKLLDA